MDQIPTPCSAPGGEAEMPEKPPARASEGDAIGSPTGSVDAAVKVEADGPQVRRLHRAISGSVTIMVDGVPMPCHLGETIATAILAQRSWIAFDGLRRHGLLCGIGLCFECAVAVDGLPGTRACMTRVAAGMTVTTEDRDGTADSAADDDARSRP